MKNPESVILEVVSTPWNVSQSQKKHYLNGRIKTSDIKSEEDNGSGEWSYTIMINTTAARILWTLTMEIDDNLLHSYLHILTGSWEKPTKLYMKGWINPHCPANSPGIRLSLLYLDLSFYFKKLFTFRHVQSRLWMIGTSRSLYYIVSYHLVVYLHSLYKHWTQTA